MKRFIHHLQSSTGATKSEIIVVLMLGGAVLFGHIVRLVGDILSPPLSEEATRQSIVQLLDSLSAQSVALPHQPAWPSQDIADTASLQAVSLREPVHRHHAPGGVINLNTASITRLQDIPGVGEATAQAIDAYRKRSPFRRPEDIMHVRGIGEKKFSKMKPYITAP
jgi:competence ComEA-like helix-hairpin-helix protein